MFNPESNSNAQNSQPTLHTQQLLSTYDGLTFLQTVTKLCEKQSFCCKSCQFIKIYCRSHVTEK